MNFDFMEGNPFTEAFKDVFALPPTDVIIGMAGIFFFGIILGMLIYLPIAQKNSKLPLEYLSGELIWRYAPDWIIFVVGCIIFLVVSFMMVSGFMRNV